MQPLMQQKHELLLRHARQQSEGATLVMALLHTAALIDRACARELAAFDLSEGRLAVLLAIANTETSATPALVAEQLGVTRAAVTGLIDGLERQGYLARVEHPSDRRSIVLKISPEGIDALDKIGPRYGTWLDELTAGMSKNALEGALGTLSAIQRNVIQTEGENGNAANV
ncbi:MarR family transcriptional regulator [Leucobacter sp. UT-8R-CII-1-4]|uniref:MarR family winged helix-turn-helix transcriptional regulator n=1 Tax=Leucobacter sp. UT-8R-CII-1-4 TaxID=3040075 RepID=UPI0024A80F1E|nr:MarR family transcriptional regulator [Leucobacter sp. UT-8R-CII-1-4]MDI6024510.1 MarR family transcriptional regulator [Leucobacter sp. UT-8R-CII-1-4]